MHRVQTAPTLNDGRCQQRPVFDSFDEYMRPSSTGTESSPDLLNGRGGQSRRKRAPTAELLSGGSSIWSGSVSFNSPRIHPRPYTPLNFKGSASLVCWRDYTDDIRGTPKGAMRGTAAPSHWKGTLLRPQHLKACLHSSQKQRY
mmetsp:Transcript_5586/g.13965  ORF Transcript_5586/g.13965 Transcript_5586/m.13965 type:complete len:144 (+) Transcript_5586:51-482(+)